MWFSCFKPRWNGVPCFCLCFVHLFKSFSKLVGSNELRFIYNDFQERSKINALTIQQRNMTMENHGICVISFNMIQIWFPCWTCVFPSHVCHRKHDRLSWVISMTSTTGPDIFSICYGFIWIVRVNHHLNGLCIYTYDHIDYYTTI